ncbi:MAG: hypothetical protein ACJ76S_12825 [Solirubrobacteraceae bacterium]|jgi:hypothetical protein
MTQSDLTRAFDAYYYEELRNARHRGGGPGLVGPVAEGSAHPLRYDEKGLPIRQLASPVGERIRRRLAV